MGCVSGGIVAIAVSGGLGFSEGSGFSVAGGRVGPISSLGAMISEN